MGFCKLKNAGICWLTVKTFKIPVFKQEFT